MGMLTADENADLLDPKSWTKERCPVLCTDESKDIYGPGHNSFTVDEEGNPYYGLPCKNRSRDKKSLQNRVTLLKRKYGIVKKKKRIHGEKI